MACASFGVNKPASVTTFFEFSLDVLAFIHSVFGLTTTADVLPEAPAIGATSCSKTF